MGVNGVTSASFMDYAKRVGRIYLHTTFGTGADEFMSSMNTSIFSKCPKKKHWYSNPYKGSDWSNFGTKFKDAIHSVEKHEAAIRKANGGSYFKAFWKQLTTIPKVFKDEWELGGKAAKQAGKNVFWGKLGGANKALMKRMPLIGGLMALAFQFGNIKEAFTHKDGGFATGMLEVGKAAAKIGIDTAGFMVGQALIPIPFVGGIIGSMVASTIGELVLGKGFADKKKEEAGQQTYGYLPYVAQNNSGQNFQGTGGYQFNPPQATMTEEQIMKLGMDLQNNNIFSG